MTKRRSGDVIDWRDPPITSRRAGVWIDRLAPLMDHPGRWAMVYEAKGPKDAGSLAGRLRGRITIIPPGKWEFRSFRSELFARYIGPE